MPSKNPNGKTRSLRAIRKLLEKDGYDESVIRGAIHKTVEVRKGARPESPRSQEEHSLFETIQNKCRDASDAKEKTPLQQITEFLNDDAIKETLNDMDKSELTEEQFNTAVKTPITRAICNYQLFLEKFKKGNTGQADFQQAQRFFAEAHKGLQPFQETIEELFPKGEGLAKAKGTGGRIDDDQIAVNITYNGYHAIASLHKTIEAMTEKMTEEDVFKPQQRKR